MYGSSESPTRLLKAKNIKLADPELSLLLKTFNDSDLALMLQFKNAVISNYNNHKPVYRYTVWNDSFDIRVNKFKNAGAKLNITTLWASEQNRYRTSITREVEWVPDYKRFKLYHFTCLVHNLDSQIMDRVAVGNYGWLIPIHDAVLALPGTAVKVRNRYKALLEELYANRYTVLNQFRQSIGAVGFKADVDFMKLYQNTVQLKDSDLFTNRAMK